MAEVGVRLAGQTDARHPRYVLHWPNVPYHASVSFFDQRVVVVARRTVVQEARGLDYGECGHAGGPKPLGPARLL
eukprot:3020607-Pyramimonas_sp.AAC.1